MVVPRASPLPIPRPVTVDLSPAPRPAVDEAGSIRAEAPAPIPAEDQVRSTLDRYVAAFTSLDARSAARVWPSVDQQALQRAFAALESQGLTLDTCDVAVEGVNARAHCIGFVEYVRKVGSREPRVEPQEWMFTMEKQGLDWTIADLVARRAPATQPRRTP
jgi:hypothetical protein